MPWIKRSGIMLFYPFEEKRLAKWVPPYVVQPKLDGERCRGECYNGIKLVSSELNQFAFLDSIRQEVQDLGYNDIELDGELYVHGWSFNEIHSVVSRKKNRHPDEDFMQYHIFDLVSDEPQIIRTDAVNDFPEGERVRIVPSFLAGSFDEVYEYLQLFLSQGYEGIIVREINAPYVRHRSIFGMKWKPKKRDDYMIKGYSIEVDQFGREKPGRLGRVICADNEDLPFLGEYPPKKDPPEDYFSVGSGFTQKQRKDYWKWREELPGRMLKVEYQHLTKKQGVPRFGVFAGII